MAEQPRPPQVTDVRIPASLPVQVQVFDVEGKPLDAALWRAVTRDVSTRGLGLAISVDEEGARRLSATREGVRVDLDVGLGRRTVRVHGERTWMSIGRRGGHARCLLGVAYAADCDPKLVAAISEHAERSYHRPRVLRAVVAGAAAVAVVAVGLWQWTTTEQAAAAAVVEAQLGEALRLRHESTERIAGLEAEVEKLRDAGGSDALAQKERELAELQAEYAKVRSQVGQLAVQREDLVRAPAPEKGELGALEHLRRGHEFSRRNNLAAALIEYERAIALSADLAEAHLEVAVINDLYGHDEKALTSYRRYLELRPDALDALEIRQNMRDLERAVRDAGQARDGG